MRNFAYINTICISGFWIKRATYEEQPVVKFQYQTLLVAATSIQGDFVAWSTFPHLNNMLASNLRIPAVSVRNQQQVAQMLKETTCTCNYRLRKYLRENCILHMY